MTFDYLTTAANAMWADIHGQMQRTPESSARAAAHCCHALRLLSTDSSFEDAVWTVASAQRATSPEMRSDLQNRPGEVFRSYEMLITVEKEIMLLEGMNPELVSFLIDTALESVRGMYNPFEDHSVVINPEEIMNRARAIQREACSFALSLENNLQSKDRRSTIVRTIGGLAIVGFNAGSTIVSFGIGAPLAAISGALGSALVLK